jgi:hypothetical protein
MNKSEIMEVAASLVDQFEAAGDGSDPKICLADMGCSSVASRFTLGSCRPMDTKITRMVALVALLIYASETGSALSDLCPGLLWMAR